MKLLCHGDLWVLIPCYELVLFCPAAVLLSFSGPSSVEHKQLFLLVLSDSLSNHFA